MILRNKTFLLIVAVAILIILLWIGWTKLVSNAYNLVSPAPVSPLEETVEGILSQKISVSCAFKDKNGNVTRALMKNGQVKAYLPGDPKDKTTVIYKNRVGYLWNKKTAMKFSVTPEALQKVGKTQGIDFLDEVKNYKNYCKDAVISNSEFDLPKNLSFKDYSAFIQLIH